MQAPKKTPSTVLAFDYGVQKIGIALGHTLTLSARPLTIIPCDNGSPCWDDIKTLIKEWQIDAFVVGLPLTDSQQFQPITYAAQKFGRRLQQRFKKPTYFVDEYLTSQQARSQQANSDENTPIDAEAAAIILTDWFKTLSY